MEFPDPPAGCVVVESVRFFKFGDIEYFLETLLHIESQRFFLGIARLKRVSKQWYVWYLKIDVARVIITRLPGLLDLADNLQKGFKSSGVVPKIPETEKIFVIGEKEYFVGLNFHDEFSRFCITIGCKSPGVDENNLPIEKIGQLFLAKEAARQLIPIFPVAVDQATRRQEEVDSERPIGIPLEQQQTDSVDGIVGDFINASATAIRVVGQAALRSAGEAALNAMCGSIGNGPMGGNNGDIGNGRFSQVNFPTSGRSQSSTAGTAGKINPATSSQSCSQTTPSTTVVAQGVGAQQHGGGAEEGHQRPVQKQGFRRPTVGGRALPPFAGEQPRGGP